jgi:integrase/recombinase XerD
MKVNLTKLMKIDGASGDNKRRFVGVKLDDRERCVNLAEIKGDGQFYVSWYTKKPAGGFRLNRKSVGSDLEAALVALERKQAELDAVGAGLTVASSQEGAATLAGATATYLQEIKLTKKPKTYAAYSKSLDYFSKSCTKTYLAEIKRSDMLRYHADLRDQWEQHPRSCWNKFSNVMSFLKAQGIRGLVQKNDWPQYVEEEPEVYEKEELAKFFDACDSQELAWFKFFLMTGMREQEVMYCYWKDVNFEKKTVRVSHKPDRGWTPKAYKERSIPVPDELVSLLKQLKASSAKSCPLVFSTAGCRPKLDFLDCAKAVAERAGLDPDTFWLHKFRATFCTWALWNGVDIRTAQSWLGHNDLASTMRYLKPKPHDATVRNHVNSMF